MSRAKQRKRERSNGKVEAGRRDGKAESQARSAPFRVAHSSHGPGGDLASGVGLVKIDADAGLIAVVQMVTGEAAARLGRLDRAHRYRFKAKQAAIAADAEGLGSGPASQFVGEAA